MQLWDRDSEALLAVGGAEGAQLHGRLGGHHLGGPVRRDVDPLRLLLLDLLLDPEVGEPQPVLHTNLQVHQKIISSKVSITTLACGHGFLSTSELLRSIIYAKIYKISSKIATCLELHGRGPAKLLLDEGVVGVAPADPLGARDVVDGQLPILEAQDDLGHLVHAHHLVAPDVHRLAEVRLGQPGQNRYEIMLIIPHFFTGYAEFGVWMV